MRHISLLCVGKLKEAYWRDACAEYGKRLSAFCRLTVTEVEEERLPENPSAAQIARAVQEEGRRLLAKVPAGAAVIAWCIEGKELDSPACSETLDKLAVDGVNAAALVIGGSWGLSDDVKKAARLRLSMSPMTFPHQLARVMVIEQLYRAMQISQGGKYHK